MSIPPRFTSELRDRLTLSEVIGRRVKLVRAGREFKACCPFHNEKSPSFYVNDDKQFYHCFGCGAHGDVIGFLMQHDKMSFVEAVETLAVQAGLQVPEQSPQDIARAKMEKTLHGLMDDAAKFFEGVLRDPAQRPVLQYLKERGMTDEMIAAFRLGFAPADAQALRTYLKGLSYTDAQMLEAGMMKPSQRDDQPYSFFRDRVMFPVADRRGRVVAFGARVLPEHLRPLAPGAAKPPKYINSGETPLFHKGRMLYGESHARQAADEGQPIIVVEGYVDVMAAFQAGYRGAVAPLGTALTEDQIHALWKMIPGQEKRPILCFDGDEAGRRAAVRACERVLPLLKPDHSALFAFLPEGQDPDSLIRMQGKKAFTAVLDGAVPLVDFIWSHHTVGRTFDTPEAKAGLSKALDEEATRIADRAVQQYYQQAFRKRLYEAFSGNSNRQYQSQAPYQQGRKGGQPIVPSMAVRRPSYTKQGMAPYVMMAAFLNHPIIHDEVEEDLGQMILPNRRLDDLRQAALAALAAEGGLDPVALRTHLEAAGFEEEVGKILSESVYLHAGFARPGAEYSAVIEGWRETRRGLERETVQKELKAAAAALAADFSQENENRVMALHDIQKTGLSEK